MTDIKFSLIPPPDWVELKLEPQYREEQLRLLVQQYRSVLALDNVHERQLRNFFAGIYDQAWDSGVRYAISSVPQPEDPVTLIATYTISIVPPADPDGEDQLQRVAESLLDEKQTLNEHERMDLEKVSLPYCGEALQIASIRYASEDKDPDKRLAILQTFIPCGNKLLVATGSTPQIDVADILFELFAEIVKTLQISLT